MAGASAYVQSRRVGDVLVTAINDAIMPSTVELTVPDAVWRPEIAADAAGQVPLAIHVLLVQTGDATILVDAGLDDPGSRWDARWREEWPGARRTPGVVAGLASLGLAPVDVTHILLTHVHFDHVVGLAAERDGRLVRRYPRARVLVGRADWEHVPAGHLGPEQRARLGAIDDAGLLELVDGARAVVPGVTMIPAPGESPGHSLLRVSSRGEDLYAVGDLFHYPAEVAHLDWMVPWADREQMQAARRTLLDAVAATAALVVFTHADFPPWGRIDGDAGSGYRWQRV